MVNRSAVVAVILVCGTLSALFAQSRPYDQVMKDTSAAFANLKKHMDTGAFPLAVEEAVRLDALFQESEKFWASFKTRDAIESSRAAQMASRSVADAARANDGAKAQTAYAAIGKSCKGFHDSHRELMPDKSYRIKP